MSRGPGRWQKLILDAITESDEWMILVAAGLSPSDASAIRRAGRILADKGLVRLGSSTVDGHARLMVRRPIEGDREPVLVTGMNGKMYRTPFIVPDDPPREFQMMTTMPSRALAVVLGCSPSTINRMRSKMS